ncbi:ribonuclease T2 family protein [Jannaschia seohaensis]|uniref:Ribonuclease T2 n=1 Tax=Jannaschia seohaensis TaxID=475081 RepID=A0A2Y9B3X4_9RHOB|nr:ribonuclease T2 [Jannaschia seohaensis]PWJ12097.1 ribonuclease T2 [Jannaschia seohaensis]SSA51200.1 ribonuclease T2 [Jannaschia seohaensis]
MKRLLAVLALLSAPAFAEGERAGAFDYYVLALSWSPTWCALEGDARQSPQCEAGRDLGFVLHGLWPQYEAGWPSYCPTGHRDATRVETAAMADIMGTSGSAWHQWKKHGRCSGLAPGDYFRLARQAWEGIVRPAALRELGRAVTLPASVVEEAFLEANPSLTPEGVTVTCRSGRIREVRLCLTRSLEPRDCAPDVARDCSLDDALLAPVR